LRLFDIVDPIAGTNSIHHEKKIYFVGFSDQLCSYNYKRSCGYQDKSWLFNKWSFCVLKILLVSLTPVVLPKYFLEVTFYYMKPKNYLWINSHLLEIKRAQSVPQHLLFLSQHFTDLICASTKLLVSIN
jgi:hypothetical protein